MITIIILIIMSFITGITIGIRVIANTVIKDYRVHLKKEEKFIEEIGVLTEPGKLKKGEYGIGYCDATIDILRLYHKKL